MMPSEKEIGAAIKAFQIAHTAKVDIPLEQSMRDALEAAARVREEANAGEPVTWGEDIDGKIVSVRLDKSRHCTVPLYPAPQPSRASLADAEKAFLDRVWPKLQNGCYRTHGSNPVEIRGLNFNEFVRDGLCAVLEATAPQPSGKTEEAAQIIQAFIDQEVDYIMRNNTVEEALHHLKIIEGEANRVTNPATKNNLLYEIERIRSALMASKSEQAVRPSLGIAGYRLLAPGELDAETLERAAQVAESTPAYGDPVEISVGLGPVGERIASAIRALKDSQPQTERQAE